MNLLCQKCGFAFAVWVGEDTPRDVIREIKTCPCGTMMTETDTLHGLRMAFGGETQRGRRANSMRGCAYRTIDDVCMKNSQGTEISYCKSPCEEQEPEKIEGINTGLEPFEYFVFKMALEAYGTEAQEKMLLEEMAELQKKICKHWRGKDNVIEIAEEMADLSIMMDQMKMRFEIFDTFNQARKFKVLRLNDRLAERAADSRPYEGEET